ncbi:MAG: hypothetical protein QOG15_3757 [Solirubrobacteraceae bacterium]|jgi:hypothetical protein|nr:hypothetical protein [Solirubrobacteraceae bacterium]
MIGATPSLVRETDELRRSVPPAWWPAISDRMWERSADETQPDDRRQHEFALAIVIRGMVEGFDPLKLIAALTGVDPLELVEELVPVTSAGARDPRDVGH